MVLWTCSPFWIQFQDNIYAFKNCLLLNGARVEMSTNVRLKKQNTFMNFTFADIKPSRNQNIHIRHCITISLNRMNTVFIFFIKLELSLASQKLSKLFETYRPEDVLELNWTSTAFNSVQRLLRGWALTKVRSQLIRAAQINDLPKRNWRYWLP